MNAVDLVVQVRTKSKHTHTHTYLTPKTSWNHDCQPCWLLYCLKSIYSFVKGQSSADTLNLGTINALSDCFISGAVTVCTDIDNPEISQVLLFHPDGDQHTNFISKWAELTLLHSLDLLLEVSVFVPHGSRFANETELSVISQLMQIRWQEGCWKGKMTSSVLQGHCPDRQPHI